VDVAAVSFAWQSGGDVRHDVRVEGTGTLQKEQVPAVMGEGHERDVCAYDPQPDGRRYAAAGDGVVANVAEWIARRIVEYEDGA
jgi:hypothetical protein